MTLRTQSEKEKSRARKEILIGFVALGAIGVIEVIFGGWFADAFFNGFIDGDFDLIWNPPGSAESLETLVASILLPFTAFIFSGFSTLLEDFEVRTHSGPSPIYNPMSWSLGIPATVLFIGGIASVLRQAYLLIWVY